MDKTWAQTINSSGDAFGYYSGAMGYTWQYTFSIYQCQFQKNMIGDGYDVHGYTGPVPGSVTYPGSIQYVYSWS